MTEDAAAVTGAEAAEDAEVTADATGPAARELYLVRHGRTVLNAQDRLRGLADPVLDDTGVAQAHAAARALAGRGIRTVVCSPLQRAPHTAEVLAAIATDRPPVTIATGSWSLLRRHAGVWSVVEAGVVPAER